ncbi:hypothetical protein BIFANG_03726 [Bifidobacterium angulatum DSM 20098 = JCM 7096]|uniref:Uncharacterized protein n=1 Tax=Bifidobacterium angulatum DSM 20098 = JCM 7096 TaxID=518635 RepID=C4FH90_9BIFI|nr:hypothetical protein BIFANG_03726 [Bifidobacterium angulatum DSM 20098 = JCM 7096]
MLNKDNDFIIAYALVLRGYDRNHCRIASCGQVMWASSARFNDEPVPKFEQPNTRLGPLHNGVAPIFDAITSTAYQAATKDP